MTVVTPKEVDIALPIGALAAHALLPRALAAAGQTEDESNDAVVLAEPNATEVTVMILNKSG